MTKINRMVIKGFKSFGNRIDLVFGGGYNCILGPNGSGKSNIMDALCFVLGKGSAKGLRAEKSANLIYNGGKTKQPAKNGEVSIYFDNASKIFPTLEGEVKITRVIKQDGQSVYKINEKRRTRQQILELLSIANIDPDGYNIILQGDIIRLIEMSTVERRLLIEEIAGITVYEDKKKKALGELEKVEQKMNEAEIILTERQTYLKELKKERDQAMEYKGLSDKIGKNKATYLDIQIKRKEERRDAYDKEIKSYQDSIDKIQKDIAALKEEVTKKKDDIARINKEVEEKGEKEQVAIMKEVETLKVDIATNKTRISSCENEVARINTRKNQLLQSLSELDNKIEELNKERINLEKSRASNQKDIDLIEKKIKEFRAKNKLDGAENIEKEIEQIDALADEKQKEIQALREQQQNMLREKDKIEFQLHTIDEQIEKVLSIEKESRAELAKLKQKREEFKKTTLELNTLLNEDSSLSAQLGNARQKLLNLKEELSKLESKNSGIRESLSSDIAVKSIMEEKGKLGDIYGTVSQLGNVESKYSLALEIAAGPKIKSIVVDNDKTAASCIKYLKQKKLGVASFLPLNKIKNVSQEQSIKEYLNANGVVGMAVDLISYEPKFRNVFSYVFGNTLVVEDIDVARRIGIGNARMVTLDGDMAEISGAMHGGFRQKQRGLQFQEKELAADISKKQKELADNEKLVDVLDKRKNEIEERITRLRDFKANLEGEIIVAEKSLHLESGDLDATKKTKSDLTKSNEEIDKQINEVQLKISSSNKDLANAKIKKQNLRDKITQLRNPVLLAELNTFEQKKSQLKDDINNVDSNIRSINMQVANILKPEKDNITKILKQHEKEEEGFKTEKIQLGGKIKVQSADLVVKEKQQKAFYAKFKELFGERDKVSNEMQKVEGKIIAGEENARSKEQRMNIVSIENAKVKTELDALYADYSKYKDIELFKNKSEEELKKEIWEFERMVEKLGTVNLKALEVYDAVEKEYNSLLEKRETLKAEKEEVFVMINEIDTKKKELFMKTFDVVNTQFQEMFKALSTKGEAFLHIENPEKPFDEGVGIKVRIIGKKFLDIRSLSGGEKTMTALAFVFAIQEHQPASFYFFDEVDAALDKRNSEKLSELIEKYSTNAQYIIISHNDNIIGHANTLYGVSMDTLNMSKVVSLKV